MHKLNAEQKAEACTMYQAGASIGGCAEHFGVTRQAMWDVLRRRIELRPQLRRGSDNHFYRDGKRANDHAQNLLEQAIEDGVVARKHACEECGASGQMRDGRTIIQAHHDDYNHPLDVRWLCQRCHHKWHKNNRPVPKREAA